MAMALPPLRTASEVCNLTGVGENSHNVSRSRASSSSGIDDLDLDFDIDPEAVDFEPLLVSGTGKILSYHNESFFDSEDAHSENGSDTSSVMTPVTSNVNMYTIRPGANRKESRSAIFLSSVLETIISRVVLPLIRVFDVNSPSSLIVIIAASALFLCTINGGSLFGSSNINMKRIAKKTAPDRSNIDVALLDQVYNRMRNVNDAQLAISSSKIVVWAPSFSSSVSSEMDDLLSIFSMMVSICFSRSVVYFRLSTKLGSRQNPSDNSRQQHIQQQKNGGTNGLPELIITSSFADAATTLFNDFQQGIFFALLTDPIYAYGTEFSSSQQDTYMIANNIAHLDNLLVRYLTGVVSEEHQITEIEFNLAKNMLRTRFLLISCESPLESLRRLSYFHNQPESSKDSFGGSSLCISDQFHFEKECKKIEMSRKQFGSSLSPEAVATVKSRHSYDVLLFEYSMSLFEEQKIHFIKNK